MASTRDGLTTIITDSTLYPGIDTRLIIVRDRKMSTHESRLRRCARLIRSHVPNAGTVSYRFSWPHAPVDGHPMDLLYYVTTLTGQAARDEFATFGSTDHTEHGHLLNWLPDFPNYPD